VDHLSGIKSVWQSEIIKVWLNTLFTTYIISCNSTILMRKKFCTQQTHWRYLQFLHAETKVLTHYEHLRYVKFFLYLWTQLCLELDGYVKLISNTDLINILNTLQYVTIQRKNVQFHKMSFLYALILRFQTYNAKTSQPHLPLPRVASCNISVGCTVASF
jgi:hypothetical protein